MNYIKSIINQVKASQASASGKNCDCNYSDNYYGDRICRTLGDTFK